MDEEITLTINAEELERELEAIDAAASEVENKVMEVEQRSLATFNKVLSGLHAGWLATQGFVRATGGTIQTVFRTVVGSALGAISVIAPLLTAQSLTSDPFAIVRAALGLASIATTLSALAAYENDQKELSDNLRGLNMTMHGIQSFLGVFDFT